MLAYRVLYYHGVFHSRGTSASPKIHVAIISLILTFSWRSQSRPARSHEYPLCSSEEEESTHPIEDKRGGEREREGQREGRGTERGEGERQRERERERREVSD